MATNGPDSNKVTTVYIDPGESALVGGRVLVIARQNPAQAATTTARSIREPFISPRAGFLMWAGMSALQALDAPLMPFSHYVRTVAATAVLATTTVLAINRVADRVTDRAQALISSASNLVTAKKRNAEKMQEVTIEPNVSPVSMMAPEAAELLVVAPTFTPAAAAAAATSSVDNGDDEDDTIKHQDKKKRTPKAPE